jgi:hypothetical protein
MQSEYFSHGGAGAIRGQLDADNLNYIFTTESAPKPVPLSFSVRVSDILHQLRSTLDHLVVGLAVENGHAAATSHQFPVTKSEKDFRREVERKRLVGLAEQSILKIEAMQPYKVEDHNSQSTLWILHDLNNLHKHRALSVVTVAYSVNKNILVGSPTAPAEIERLGMPLTIVRNAGQEVWRVGLAKPCPGFHVDATFKTEMGIEHPAKPPALPMLETIDKLIRYTEKVVGDLLILSPGTSF